MKSPVNKSEALNHLMQGKTLKCDMKDGKMEIKRTADGTYVAIVSTDVEIEGSREHTFRGDFKNIVKTLNGVVGDCDLYIEE